MTLKSGYLLLFAALILGATLRVPGWFTAEEKARWRLFEVDEEQHVAIVMERYNELSNGVDTIEHKFRDLAYNVRGYGYTTAAVARIARSRRPLRKCCCWAEGSPRYTLYY